MLDSNGNESSTSDILTDILSNVRDLHASFTADARELSAINAILHDWVGNGRPGRLQLLESAVDSLERWRSNIKGRLARAALVCGGVVTLIGWVIERLLRCFFLFCPSRPLCCCDLLTSLSRKHSLLLSWLPR